jgi:tyrosine-protein kinase Etk/Wzc
MSGEIKALEPHPDPLPPPVHVTAPNIPDVEEHRLGEVLFTLTQARVLISAITVGCVLLGALYVGLATPIYRTDLVVQVEEATRSIAGLSEISALLTDRSPSETEMEILRSRGLVGAVVDQLNLQVVATPRRFPLLGWIARRYRGSAPARPFLGLSSYAWGGERIAVERLDVPDDLLNQELTLVAGERGSYQLRGPSGDKLLEGVLGKAAAGGGVQMYVSDLSARPKTKFNVMKRSRLRVVEELQDRLKVAEKGRKTGILMVALDDPDPARAAAILDAVGTTYVRQNVERKSAEAAKTLDFLESQLPTLKANLDVAEAALKGYQVEKGTLDLSREAQAMLQRSVEIEKSLSDAELQRAELRQRFTDSHPALQGLASKIAQLQGERSAINARMRDLPGTELDSARLMRDVKVSGELYNVLLNKAQELRVVKSGTIGNVRVLDKPDIPDQPTSPVVPLVLAISTALGLMLGVATAFMRKSLYAGIDDPEMVEHVTGMTVYATVPRSPREAGLTRTSDKRAAQPLLAVVEPGDPAVEAMRSLRTGLQFALLEARNNVIVVTGPTADVGKSFVTANLAHVFATAGRRVIVVDGDLRRGRVHRFFGGQRTPGLSDVLTGTSLLSDATRESSVENLHWMPTGRIPPNPAELVGSDRFERVLSELSSRYDLVLVDTAPILPVTDAALIARHAATTLLVLRAGAHPVREILASVKRLAQNGIRAQGAVFNDVSGAGARYSKYGYQYRYDSRA